MKLKADFDTSEYSPSCSAKAGAHSTVLKWRLGFIALLVAALGLRRYALTHAERLRLEEFLALAPKVPVRTTVETFPLEQANQALARLREGRINGAAVLVMPPELRA